MVKKHAIADEKRRFFLCIFLVVLGFLCLQFAFEVLQNRVEKFFPGIPGLFYVLMSVALLHPLLWALLRVIYKAPYSSLLVDQPEHFRLVSKRAFFQAQYFLLGLFLLSEPLFLALNWQTISFRWQPDWGRWALWFFPLLCAIALQTSAEEILFRGLLQSKIKSLWKAPHLSIFISAFLWALIHQAMFNAMVFKIAVVGQMFVIGIIFGLWVERSASIWGPIFTHFLMNAFTMLIYGNTLRPTDFYLLQSDFRALTRETQLFYFALVALCAWISYQFFIQRNQKD